VASEMMHIDLKMPPNKTVTLCLMQQTVGVTVTGHGSYFVGRSLPEICGQQMD